MTTPDIRPEKGTRWRLTLPDGSEEIWVVREVPPNPDFFYIIEPDDDMSEILTETWEIMLELGMLEQLTGDKDG
jgi:hypothetical protein